MPENVFGVPVHPLIVHAAVFLLPTAALGTVLSAVWPAVRRQFGLLALATAAAALVVVPLATQSGESLQRRLPEQPLIERHQHLADQMLPWAVALFLAALAVMIVERRATRAAAAAGTTDGDRTSRPVHGGRVAVVVAVFAIVAAAGTTQQVVRVGHSGAKAVWSGVPAAR